MKQWTKDGYEYVRLSTSIFGVDSFSDYLYTAYTVEGWETHKGFSSPFWNPLEYRITLRRAVDRIVCRFCGRTAKEDPGYWTPEDWVGLCWQCTFKLSLRELSEKDIEAYLGYERKKA